MYILAVLALARVSSLNSSICNGCGCAACVAHDAPSTDNRHCRSVVKYCPFARRRHTCCHHTARGALPAVAQPQQSRYGKRCTALFRLVELDNAVAVIERLMRPAHRLITSLGNRANTSALQIQPIPLSAALFASADPLNQPSVSLASKPSRVRRCRPQCAGVS